MMESAEISGVVAIVSGGLDSSVMLWLLAQNYYPVKEVISFNYGQRHQKELDHASKIVAKFSQDFYPVDHRIVDVSNINELISRGSLTGSDAVPKKMYDDTSQRVTIVPNRNMIFIAIAAGRGVTLGASHVAYAAHASDHEVYPDCRPDFIHALDQALYLGNLWDPIHLYAPFQNHTKADVVKLGLELQVPFELTWSCYEGSETPCLECGTCLERTEAFLKNNKQDPALDERLWEEAEELYLKHRNED